MIIEKLQRLAKDVKERRSWEATQFFISNIYIYIFRVQLILFHSLGQKMILCNPWARLTKVDSILKSFTIQKICLYKTCPRLNLTPLLI